MRMVVEFILELLANGWTVDDILRNYPQLKRELKVKGLILLRFASESSRRIVEEIWQILASQIPIENDLLL